MASPSAAKTGTKPDIRTDLMSDEEYERNCAHYAEYAFYTPPEKFLFHHYDEPPDKPLICHRPMIGIEKYVVEGINGGFYGTYDTRDISKYIKTGTWIVVPDNGFFVQAEIKELESKIQSLKAQL